MKNTTKKYYWKTIIENFNLFLNQILNDELLTIN